MFCHDCQRSHEKLRKILAIVAKAGFQWLSALSGKCLSDGSQEGADACGEFLDAVEVDLLGSIALSFCRVWVNLDKEPVCSKGHGSTA